MHMMYAIQWSNADQKGIVATTSLHDDLVAKIIAIYGTNINISVVDHADEADLAFGEAIEDWDSFADINLDDDDEETPQEYFEELCFQYEKDKEAQQMEIAAQKVRFNEHGLRIRAAEAPICVETQIELALYDINRIMQEIASHRDNHETTIALPNGQQVTFKKFTGSRENGYQIGLVYMQVDNGTERKVRSYRTTINWLEQMKHMPISALAQMNF